MIEITIEGREYLNDKNMLVSFDDTTLQLEHSLISIKKWEAKYHKAFLERTVEKTGEEMFDYIKMMSIKPVKNQDVFAFITEDQMKKIAEYMGNPMTASTVNAKKEGGFVRSSTQILTADLIYAWMVILRIPQEYSKWHINELLVLIEIVSIEQQPKKKMSMKDRYARINKANAARRHKKH